MLDPSLPIPEHPALFSAPMIWAIRDGEKLVTRRVLKVQPQGELFSVTASGQQSSVACFGIMPNATFVRCPYGAPGHHLWVREGGWQRPERSAAMMREGADTWPAFEYDADGISHQEHEDLKRWGWRRRNSIHMSRQFSRFLLEVTEVRVERLQDLTPEQARLEGIKRLPVPLGGSEAFGVQLPKANGWAKAHDPVGAFRQLWEALGGNWHANPWVWAVSFKVIENGVRHGEPLA